MEKLKTLSELQVKEKAEIEKNENNREGTLKVLSEEYKDAKQHQKLAYEETVGQYEKMYTAMHDSRMALNWQKRQHESEIQSYESKTRKLNSETHQCMKELKDLKEKAKTL